ncbi:FecR family protein [Pseudomonas sp. 14P_8.1_Bac3]|uniref:FecR family protein n=1 Tax=Pseudomonas sp. 14P_8.1_Bac3 TaxID=2971621 RepID=UPI0021C83EC0|nr:FecR family protein [Pseudomonas sp. 14P_8.1_Bac3]MCU1763580.1 FecR family protein [Pseudomonas sp. 14P_8.1_Bac3]
MTEPQRSIDEQAAHWLIRLNEADIDNHDRQQFEAWKNKDPRHAAAAERLQAFVGRLQALRPQQAPVQVALSAAFVERRRSRRTLAGGTALALLLALPLGVWMHSYPPDYWLADLRTAPGQWNSQRLEDNSQITLSGNSAVDVRFDGTRRQVELLRGEILVQVAHDAARPFTVITDDGQMRALGTRFTVRRDEHSTVLTMLESTVAAKGSESSAVTEVKAGQQVRITTQSVHRLGDVEPRTRDQAWQQHQLVIQDRPLPEVLDEVARQINGRVQFDRAGLADLRVSAVLPLDDPDRALKLIADALPVRVRQFTPWLVWVDRRP